MTQVSAPVTRSDRSTNRTWLQEQMNPYFFITMKDEPEAMTILERELGFLRSNRRLILADRDRSLILAMPNQPGTLYETLRRLPEQGISYAMIAHSNDPIPGLDRNLEIQRFEFDRKSDEEIAVGTKTAVVPPAVRKKVAAALRQFYPDFDFADTDRLLRILWLNNENYVRIAPARRVAQTLRLFQQANRRGGVYLDVEEMEENPNESRVLFAVGNPPQRDFLLQIMEIFNRLNLGVNRAYCLTISNGIHPYFLGNFYVRRRDGGVLSRGTEMFARLQNELANTQILATRSQAYRDFVANGMMSGEEATLVNTFIAFCHTNLAHNQPDRFGADDVASAFHAHPEIALDLIRLFRLRFDPDVTDRSGYERTLKGVRQNIEDYNTGHRHLDEIRRSIFRCALLLIRHTLKTNFFVIEKQALAFRLDPAYLADLGSEFTADLPQAVPFRITFFFSRYGCGYHIGFSDIARGGWRTVITRNQDDYVTNANTLFRENFVLAHTQHLKNKDIYEGGSKMVLILDASDLSRASERDMEILRLYKLQYGVFNAFLDIYVTGAGVVCHGRVVDYYREDEPIELGPDENMHDSMIEAIARLSERRGYILGIGVMSSKRVGINHKEYGVTSTGVVKFAEITMAEAGTDIRRDPFTVKLTGGPNGDVAGNTIRILLERSPQAKIVLILDGTAALVDPAGADPAELRRILLAQDLDAFDPRALHPGGFMLFRTGVRMEGLRSLYRKVTQTDTGLREEWISVDDFHRQFDSLVFTVPADLFIPAGGRPETIDAGNWHRFLLPDGTPSSRIIVEGANSFITPEARLRLQQRGATIMRDASANKCGVISSSYEILANLLLSEQEFLANKGRYVEDVLAILERRAAEEATVILKRRKETPGLPCTEISDALSTEINALYARLFSFFARRPHLCLQPPFRKAILAHLPRILQEEPRFRSRIRKLPRKYLFAILAAEIASSIVYRGSRSEELEDTVRLHLARHFR